MAKKKAENAEEKGGSCSPPPPVNVNLPIVGIGASAGAVEALELFLGEIPPDTGAAYVVIVHLDPTHASELAQILADKVHLPIEQVTRKTALEPNKIYVIPPDRRLLVSDHTLDTKLFDEPRGQRAPIDQFFRSLAEQRGDGIAVVLTGAGSDGAIGVKAIKERGGLILVQDPDEAEFPSMPKSAIATGLADVVLPVRELASHLVELIATKAHAPAESPAPSEEEALLRVLTYLRSRTGHDFLRYKRSTIWRRCARRMQLRKVDGLGEYLNYLKRKPEEVQQLFHDLLISVTTFFRDPAAFEVLASKVIAPLFEEDEAAGPLRVWVPGCATGEEAYSIAMLLADEAARRDARREIQVFASDLDAIALATAREGCYPVTIEADVGEDRLRRYFLKEGDHYRVRSELRENVLFATHSLLKDPPFSKLNLVSCRNLLIYLEKELQLQVLATFNYALRPGGYLFLGSSETADIAPSHFRVFDREAKIYQSKGSVSDFRELPHLVASPRMGEVPIASPGAATAQPPVTTHLRALECIGPPSMLIDANHQIVNISEHAGRYIQPSGGQIRNDVTELVRPEVRFDLRSALHRAFERDQPSLSLGIPVRFNGAPRRVYLQVCPVATSDGARQAVVFFIEGDAAEETEADDRSERDDASEATIRHLKEELELTRSRLRASREEFEAANEELRAANEELQSVNEEYRSTAEELETSKEELQSINEELQTVNAELKSKLDIVSRANNDLQNLMDAADVGTLFLDNQLMIKRFTPRITELFNIKATDEGRPITDFTRTLEYDEFPADAQAVLKDLKIIEREVASKGRWFLTRLRPYRTLDDRIEGVVCTFVDITERLKTQQALKVSEERLRLLLSELSHRVKNTLAVVQSLARQSFNENVPREQALETFSSRLRALAEAHNLLVSSDWRGADFRELAARQVAPYATQRGQKVSSDGPAVTLPPQLATPLALVLHELAANAFKHGALSAPDGSLRLSWGFEGSGDHRVFEFTWQEQGGPPPSPSVKGGFGSWLVKHSVPDAKVTLTFPSAGAVCHFTVPAKLVEQKE